MKGKVYLVGAGPGDPGLITLKGLECIKQADVLIYDFLASSVLLKHASKDAEIIYVGKNRITSYNVCYTKLLRIIVGKKDFVEKIRNNFV